MSHFWTGVVTIPGGPSVERLLSPYKKGLMTAPYVFMKHTDEEYADHRRYWDENLVDLEGNLLSNQNPHAKWEGFSVKDSISVQEALNALEDPLPPAKAEAKARFWEVVVEGSPLKTGERPPFCLYDKEFYIRHYGTKENFVNHLHYLTFALVTPYGEWMDASDQQEEGRVFADRYKQALQHYANIPGSTFTYVDCWI